MSRVIKSISESKVHVLNWQKDIEIILYQDSSTLRRKYKKRYNVDGMLNDSVAFKYDDLGRSIKMSVFNYKKLPVSYSTAEYDKKNSYILSSYNEEGDLVLREKRPYYTINEQESEKDEYGNYTKLVLKDNSRKGYIREYRYKYNEHGNWIERTVYVRMSGFKVKKSKIKRKIRYND